MLTREEMLQKGIDAETVENLFNAFEARKDTSSPLDALEKAIVDIGKKKAKKGENKDDDSSKKKGALEKGEEDIDEDVDVEGNVDDPDDDDVDLMKKKKTELHKAISDISFDDDEISVFNGRDVGKVFKAVADSFDALQKAVERISERQEANINLVKALASFEMDTNKTVSSFAGESAGRKGIVAAGTLAKAGEPVSDKKQISDALFKAMGSGNLKAAEVAPKYEAVRGDLSRLNVLDQQFIADLLKGA